MLVRWQVYKFAASVACLINLLGWEACYTNISCILVMRYMGYLFLHLLWNGKSSWILKIRFINENLYIVGVRFALKAQMEDQSPKEPKTMNLLESGLKDKLLMS